MTTSTLYTLSTELPIVRSLTGEWLRVDILDMPLNAVYDNYRAIEIGIHGYNGKAYTLDLYRYESELRHLTITFRQWFGTIADRSLVLKTGSLALKLADANYLPGNICFKTCRLAKRDYHPSIAVPADDYDDVVVTHDKVSPEYFHDYTLCSVAGYYVRSTWHNYGMRLLGAGDVVRRANDTSLGVLNFERIGKIKKIPIRKTMVAKVDDQLSYYNSLTINAGVSLTNKTVGIVIGGYLHLLDGVVKVISDRTVMLSLMSLPIIERVLASKDHLDLSVFGVDTIDINAIVNRIRSEDAILSYLTHEHSFLVVIDNPYMFKADVLPDTVNMPGKMFHDADAILGPLYDQRGKCIDYYPTITYGKWELHTDRDAVLNYKMQSTSWQKEIRINDALVGNNRYDLLQPTMRLFKARV